jgi:hypothetical protein
MAWTGAKVKQHRRNRSGRREILDCSRQAAGGEVSFGLLGRPFPSTIPKVPAQMIACQFHKQPGSTAMLAVSLRATRREMVCYTYRRLH